MEPEDIVSEPVWEPESQVKVKFGARGYGVRARLYDRSYGVEPVDIVSEPVDMVVL